MSEQQFHHVSAGALPHDPGAQLSFEELSSIFKDARKAVFSVSAQLKDLFSDLETTFSDRKLSTARETVAAVHRMVIGGEIPLKLVIYRRNPEFDPYLHAFNVSALSMALGQQLDLDEAALLEVGLAALLHDIGYHLFPTLELARSATISLDEKKREWEHPIRGAKFLAATPNVPDLVPIVAYEHHLHYDGGGYPQQQRPRSLNLAGMITGITNCFDSLRENRPGRTALSLADTINWMDQRGGTQFHPVLFKRFRSLIKAQVKEEV
jgi:HD-GYP domain-containing protein (c-di-GMP phosphodiesterase class II)